MVETFHHRGRVWTRYPARAIDRFVVGCDLAQSVDYTAIAVMHHRVEPLQTWTTSELGSITQDVAEHFEVRHLERMRGETYPTIVEHVVQLMSRSPLRNNSQLVADQTGVGAAVIDLLAVAGLDPIRVTITAGHEPVDHGGGRWSVPKSVLVSAIDAQLHIGNLKIASALSEAGNLSEELRDFRRKVSESGRASYAARATRHDDLVLSLALSLWWARQDDGQPKCSVTEVVGMW